MPPPTPAQLVHTIFI